MRHDKTCNILGRYCWTHKLNTQPGIPGWPKAMKASEHGNGSLAPKEAFRHPSSKYIGTNPYEQLTSVVWLNGDANSSNDTRPCAVCEKHCEHPVERSFTNQYDGYRAITVGKLLDVN